MQFCIFCILSSNHMFAPYHAIEKYTVTHLTLLYLPITEGWKQRFCFQENKISCPRHKEV